MVKPEIYLADERSITLFSGDDSPDTTFWFWCVTRVARDEMDMDVGNGLPGGIANIDTDIKSVWMIMLLQIFLAFIDHCPKELLFFRGQIKVAGKVPPGNNQCVPRSNRKRVQNGATILGFKENILTVLWLTKGTKGI